LALLAVSATAESPITKVLELMSSLQQKVLKDGEVEQKQYEKFAEYCEDTAVKTQYEIKDLKAKSEELSAAIEKAAASITTEEATIGELAKTIATNNKDLSAATEIRDKEAADFAAADADMAETIDMLGRAIGILEKNMKGGSFMQVAEQFSDVMAAMEVVMKASVFSTHDKNKLEALMQEDDDEGEPQADNEETGEALKSRILKIYKTPEDERNPLEMQKLSQDLKEWVGLNN
jgi:molecular chaperone GrpE (heat shock protein)